MTELTDLEICKRIAEIEGEVIAGIGEHNVYIKCQPSLVGNVQYNPLTDDALNHQLMIKYELDLISPYRKNGDTQWEAQIFTDECSNVESAYDDNPNKVILLAIIAAHKES